MFSCQLIKFSLLASTSLLISINVKAQVPLPLGSVGIPEKVDSVTLAPGVTLTHIVRGQVSPQDGYAVDVPFNTDQIAVLASVTTLVEAGFSPEVINVQPPQDAPPGFFGAVVRLGVFTTQELADSFAQKLAAKSFTNITTDYTGYNGFKATTGPWVVNIIDIDPTKFRGTVRPVRAEMPEGRETTSSIAKRTGALVAINAGYFVISKSDGTPGAPVGLSVIDGKLYHESTDGRSPLGFLPSGEAFVDKFRSFIYATSSSGSSEKISGLNRRPSIQRDCGGPVEELPSNQPRQDFNCTIPDDLVLFTPEFGDMTDAELAAVEVVLDNSDHVTSIVNGGNVAIPADGTVLAATGAKALWLRSYARLGLSLRVSSEVLTSFGLPIPSWLRLSIVNAGPHLVQNGKIDIDATAEGFAYALPGNSNEYYGFGLSRNPRTLAGRTQGGHLLLVTVDGRQPGYSVGVSFDESARLMRSLGSIQATNLDGGGSTTIAVNGDLLNQPSDATGERPVGEVIAVIP